MKLFSNCTTCHQKVNNCCKYSEIIILSVLESVAEVVTPSILHVPPEVLLQIFKYLSPQDLCRCAQVNTVFSKAAFDSSLWHHLHPVKWFTGNWKFLPPRHLNLQQLEDDCDEEDTSNNDSISLTVRLCDFVRHLLPKIGEHVKTLDLARAGRMDIKYVRMSTCHA